MSDDKTNRGAQDRARINVHEDHEVRRWTQALGVTREQLAAAVIAVGVSLRGARAPAKAATLTAAPAGLQLADLSSSSGDSTSDLGGGSGLVLDGTTLQYTVQLEPSGSARDPFYSVERRINLTIKPSFR